MLKHFLQSVRHALEAAETPTSTTTPVNGMARYYYDGNGTMVKSVIGEVVTYYASSAYQVKTDGVNLLRPVDCPAPGCANLDTNYRKYYTAGERETRPVLTRSRAPRL